MPIHYRDISLPISVERMAYAKGVAHLHVELYGNKRLALTASQYDDAREFEEALCTFTVNMPNQPCPPDEVWIKAYSENEGAIETLVDAGIIFPNAEALVRSGFVAITRHKLQPGFLALLRSANLTIQE